MITVAEINKKAKALYKSYLSSIVREEPFFPCLIRSNKQVSTDFAVMQKELAEVASGSTDRRGYGYKVYYETKMTRRHGVQSLPEKIVFETETDYLRFLSKEEEAKLFKVNLSLIVSCFPALCSWCEAHPLWVVEYAGVWTDLLKVCSFFCACPQPKLYVRELPVEVHTKFIEWHIKVLQSLLNELLPIEKTNSVESDFYKRFGLKQPETLVRFRLLDDGLQSIVGGLSDLSVPVSEFARMKLPCRYIFIVENLMNFLTFPKVAGGLLVWGKGFQVEVLKGCKWLSDVPLVYWGDMDVHGFQILSQVRSYFPDVISLMMDKKTFETFGSMRVENKVPYPPALNNLTMKEAELYEYLKANSLRLEQEKITYKFEQEQLYKLLKHINS